MLQLVSTYREFREFLAAKKRKREPIRWSAKPVACAAYKPSGARGFANFRAALRGVGDFGQASERLDALENALRKRHACGLPTPRKVMQNEDRSLAVFWDGAMVRCMTDGIVSLIGGSDGIPSKGITIELLDLLAFQSRIQGNR